MKIHKFFTFTIKGDELNPVIIRNNVNMPCDIFIKGETVKGALQREILQKTNRWAYREELNGKLSVSVFLTKQLEFIFENLSTLKEYIEKYDSSIELVLYAGNKTDITLSRKQIELLEKIGVSFSVSFC